MKRIMLVTVVVMCVVQLSWAAEAEKKEVSELTRAREQYQKELVAAAEPIQRKYVETLKKLQEQLAKAGKLQEAVAVQEEAKSIADGLVKGKPSFLGKAKWTPHGKWVWNGLACEITEKDLTNAAGAHWQWHYAKGQERTIVVLWENREHYCTFAPDNKSFKIVLSGREVGTGVRND